MPDAALASLPRSALAGRGFGRSVYATRCADRRALSVRIVDGELADAQ